MTQEVRRALHRAIADIWCAHLGAEHEVFDGELTEDTAQSVASTDDDCLLSGCRRSDSLHAVSVVVDWVTVAEVDS